MKKRLARALVLPLLLASTPALATEFHVTTAGDDTADGSAGAPFRSVDRGLNALHAGDTLTIHAGTYRLMEGPGADTVSAPDSTAALHITIQAAAGDTVTLLGSLSTAGHAWEPSGAGLWRSPADFLPHDPTGMFEGETRIAHVMETRGGARSHAPTSQLTDAGQWTKADTNGAGCGTDNAGCFVWLRLAAGEDPNTHTYELSQRLLTHFENAPYAVVRGLRFAYTQPAALTIETGRGYLIEGNVFAHNSNGDDNAYSIFVSYAGGVTVRNNEAFDSEYWGGFSNSKGPTFMDMDPADPSTLEGNYIHDIVGQCAATKDGVSGLVVRRNRFERCAVGVEPADARCHWRGCDPASGGFNYPGGSWQIYENEFVGGEKGVWLHHLRPAGATGVDDVVVNNVFDGQTICGVDRVYVDDTTLVANNVFIRTARGVVLDAGNGGTTRAVADFLPLIVARDNLYFSNTSDWLLRPDWTGPEYSGTTLSLSDAASANVETGALSGDPLFIAPAMRDYHLAPTSPARGRGDGTFYGLTAVDVGRYPLDSVGDGDAGYIGVDAGPTHDGGGADGGTGAPRPGGCGCRAGGRATRGTAGAWLALGLVVTLARRRRGASARLVC